jgi:hypothetical protein
LRFESVDKLLEQIWKDIEDTKRILRSAALWKSISIPL